MKRHPIILLTLAALAASSQSVFAQFYFVQDPADEYVYVGEYDVRHIIDSLAVGTIVGYEVANGIDPGEVLRAVASPSPHGWN